MFTLISASNIDRVSEWLKANELLATLVIIPLVSMVLAALSARYAAKRAIASERAVRVHQSAIEIAGYRQAWIDGLRNDLAEFTGLTTMSFNGTPPSEIIERASILVFRIRMRMNKDDPDYQELVSQLNFSLAGFLQVQVDSSPSGRPLCIIAQSILKREWERLKKDLREADQ